MFIQGHSAIFKTFPISPAHHLRKLDNPSVFLKRFSWLISLTSAIRRFSFSPYSFSTWDVFDNDCVPFTIRKRNIVFALFFPVPIYKSCPYSEPLLASLTLSLLCDDPSQSVWQQSYIPGPGSSPYNCSKETLWVRTVSKQVMEKPASWLASGYDTQSRGI